MMSDQLMPNFFTKRLVIEDCKLFFYYLFFLLNMIHKRILSVFFVEIISFDIRITFIFMIISDVRIIAIIGR